MICCGEALLPVVLAVAPLVPELLPAPFVAEALDDALGDPASPEVRLPELLSPPDTLPVATGL
jgi:hypothetical protein